MAEELFDVAEFWLPSDFVYDDLLLEADRRWKAITTAPPSGAEKSFLAADLVSGFVSNSDSLATDRSVDSDEEDFLAGLTQRINRSFLSDVGKDTRDSRAPGAVAKPRETAGSPQSTLCSWPGAPKKSNSNCPTLACSQPLSTEKQPGLDEPEPWSLPSEVAGQLMRLKLSDLEHRRHLFERGLLGPQRKPSPAVPPPSMNVGNATGYSTTGHLPTLQQLRAVQFYRLKQLQLLKQQQQQQQQEQQLWVKQRHEANCEGGYGEARCDRPPLAWPPLQKQRQHTMTGSGESMRAVFLNSAKKQCAGTGVFIPRTAGGKVHEPPRKKTVSSTVLVPTRVVQALNLNLEEFGAQPRFPGGFSVDHDKPSAALARSNAPLQNKLNHLHVRSPTATTARDLRLPQEWSY